MIRGYLTPKLTCSCKLASSSPFIISFATDLTLALAEKYSKAKFQLRADTWSFYNMKLSGQKRIHLATLVGYN